MPRKRSIPEDESRPEPQSVIEYLRTASPAQLMDFEMSRLNEAANLKKQLADTFERIFEVMSDARLARMLMEHRKQLLDRRGVKDVTAATDLLDVIQNYPKLLNPEKKARRMSRDLPVVRQRDRQVHEQGRIEAAR